MRKPKAADYMGLDGSAGLTDALVGRVKRKDVIQRWGKGSLSVLPTGNVPPNPRELLRSKNMDGIFESLNSAFDFVLYDYAPLISVTDASFQAIKVGGLVLTTNPTKLIGAFDCVRGEFIDVAKKKRPLEYRIPKFGRTVRVIHRNQNY